MHRRTVAQHAHTHLRPRSPVIVGPGHYRPITTS
ncbi:hypothetical protein Ae168Ps1_1131 [Pseudonocardia sp. Ae168_Ps1]|nr:hypothetical protein Ae150APs1_1130 [Pseudonocardia sp. Ae150A_Ps1]OLL78725.1 hypothetical protein Ae168Ps1_1131 [Pseudonocardia sp. Ae168_Ps1]OLL87147.1 hypothetical protein Ae263Ps1_4202c [Pseudonocardia sp. Ae263_Ps1]OLL92823.1 hypothetical protein Ae356Ps1_2720 [Pseudonocardia sp. Ae356_Ps1]